MATTPNRLNRFPVGADAADVPLWMERLALDLDFHAQYRQGPDSSIPTPGTVGGMAGDFYHGTTTGKTFVSNGSAWRSIGIPDDSAVTGAKIATDAVTSPKLNLEMLSAVGAGGNLTTSAANYVTQAVTPHSAAVALVLASCYMNVTASSASGNAGRAVITLDGSSTVGIEDNQAAEMVLKFSNTSGSTLGTEADLSTFGVFVGMTNAPHTFAISALKDSNASTVQILRPRLQVIFLG